MSTYMLNDFETNVGEISKNRENLEIVLLVRNIPCIDDNIFIVYRHVSVSNEPISEIFSIQNQDQCNWNSVYRHTNFKTF